jgi:hypothetical protein
VTSPSKVHQWLQARDTLKAEKRALEERLAASNSTTGIAEDVEGERAAHLEDALQVGPSL